MGWASAGQIFDPVAQALIDASVDNATKTRVLGDLIKQLQDGDWDTEDESLDRFRQDPAVVEAFRRNGIYTRCDAESGDSLDCDLEAGHTGDHRDHRGRTWAAGIRQHADVLRAAAPDVRGTLQWQVHCPRCAAPEVERDNVRNEVHTDLDRGPAYGVIDPNDGRATVFLTCAAGHAFHLGVHNHKGAEYITIEP